MAQKDTNKHVLEAARAAVLATHAAAGLATGAASREVARLLRSAEALSRSAVAILSTPSTTRSSSGPPREAEVRGVPGGAGGGVPVGPAQRPRRRARRSKQKGKDDTVVGQDIYMADQGVAVAGGAPCGSTSSTGRALAHHAPVSGTPSATSPSAPVPGTRGFVRDFTSRFDVNGRYATFVRPAKCIFGRGDRWVVTMDDTGEEVTLEPHNIQFFDWRCDW